MTATSDVTIEMISMIADITITIIITMVTTIVVMDTIMVTTMVTTIATCTIIITDTARLDSVACLAKNKHLCVCLFQFLYNLVEYYSHFRVKLISCFTVFALNIE
jgi:hypothetical protein